MKFEPQHIDDELLARYLSGEATGDDLSKAEEWINASSDNKSYIENLREIWDSGSALKDFEALDVDSDWTKIKSRVSFDEESNVRQLKRDYFQISYLFKIAAIIIVACGLGFMIIKNLNEEEKETSFATNSLEEKEITLPDGSRIFLNKNSSVSYKGDFKSERKVRFSGEGFFEIKKDPSRPFLVETEESVTRVLGTSFNVKEKGKSIVVTVMTGRVEFFAKKAENKKLILNKGEEGILAQTEVRRKKAENLNTLAWKENQLVFRNTSFGEVVESLEDYFNVRIELSNPALKDCKYNGSYVDPDIKQILPLIGETLDVKFEVSGNSYKVNGKGCEHK